jgi:hypothetical protein
MPILDFCLAICVTILVGAPTTLFANANAETMSNTFMLLARVSVLSMCLVVLSLGDFIQML